jgi:hypothetical protein
MSLTNISLGPSKKFNGRCKREKTVVIMDSFHIYGRSPDPK